MFSIQRNDHSRCSFLFFRHYIFPNCTLIRILLHFHLVNIFYRIFLRYCPVFITIHIVVLISRCLWFSPTQIVTVSVSHPHRLLLSLFLTHADCYCLWFSPTQIVTASVSHPHRMAPSLILTHKECHCLYVNFTPGPYFLCSTSVSSIFQISVAPYKIFVPYPILTTSTSATGNPATSTAVSTSPFDSAVLLFPSCLRLFTLTPPHTHTQLPYRFQQSPLSSPPLRLFYSTHIFHFQNNASLN